MSESVFAWIHNFFAERRSGVRKGGFLAPALFFLVVAVLLLTLSNCEGKEEKTLSHSTEAEALVAWRLEEEVRLAEMICHLEGVEHCYVSLHFESGEESIREGGVTVSFSPARVSSVVVLYEGAVSLPLKGIIVDMVTTLYGIGSNRVSVNSV